MGYKNTTFAVMNQPQLRFVCEQQSLYFHDMNLGERLKAEREAQGLTQEKLAELSGVKQQTIQATEKRNSKKSDHATALAGALGVTVDWLLSGTPPKHPQDIANEASLKHLSIRAGPVGDDIQIRHYKDVHLSAGPGYHISDEGSYTDDSLSFKRSWLDRKGYSEKNLVVVYASGESMSPRICDGDILVVKTDENHDIHDGRVYAINYDGMVKVKRLSKRYDGSIVVSSDNPDPRYKDEIIPAHDLDLLNIIGRVVWVGGDM